MIARLIGPRRSRQAIVAACCLVGAFSRAVQGQVIPGVGMPGADSRTQAAAYRLEVQGELMAVLNDWSRFAEQAESAALATLYTESAKSVATGVADASGPGEIVPQLRLLSLHGAQVGVTVTDFDTSGDIGYVSCSLVLQPTPRGGPAATTTARATFVLVRDFRGRWHIRHQVISLP